MEANYLKNILLWFLPYIDMNQPWVYMCPPILNRPPPPFQPHPSRLSQNTSFECPASCIELALVIYFTYGNVHVSVLISQIIPPSSSPTESKSLFFSYKQYFQMRSWHLSDRLAYEHSFSQRWVNANLFASEWTNANQDELTWFNVSCGPICSCSVALSCLTLCDRMGCSPSGSSVHGIFPGKNIGVGCHFLFQGCAHSCFPFSSAGTADLSLISYKREAIHVVGLELTSICILPTKEQSCQK